MAHTVEWIDEGAIVRMLGVFDFAAFDDVQRCVFGSSKFDSASFIVFDLQSVDEIALSENELRAVAAITGVASTYGQPTFKLALVVKDEAMRLLALEHIETRAKAPWMRRIFMDLDEASAWAIQPPGL